MPRHHIPATIRAEHIREICEDSNLTFQQIIETLDISPAWMNRAMMLNEKYRFITPNPERMREIYDYARAYQTYRRAERKRFQAFQAQWE